MNIFKNLFKKKSKVPALVLNSGGVHQIGGKAPSYIKIPELNTSPIIYLGFISKNDPELQILEFDLHLLCPIFLDLQLPIFFDYSDSNNPKLIKKNVSTNFNQLFEDIPYDTYVQYQKMNFSFNYSIPMKVKVGNDILDSIDGQIGNFKDPIWIHEEQWPCCPLNCKKMKFLFQLYDIDECKTEYGQEILDKEFINNYLNFGHGYLYVFYEPESKVIAYLNQL